MRFAILLALMILTAGCLGGADTNPKNDPRPEPTDDPEPVDPPPGPNPGIPGRVALLLDFQYTQCSGIEAQFNIAPATAQALLPANFTARDDLGRTSDQALVRFRILACDQFSSANVAINDTVYGDVAILIDDPGIEASGDLTWYRLRIFAADDNLALAWQIAGYDVVI